jgi:hypothetical protein
MPKITFDLDQDSYDQLHELAQRLAQELGIPASDNSITKHDRRH